MALEVWTARVSYSGADGFNVTRKGGDARGRCFAPSWALLSPFLEKRKAGTLIEVDWLSYQAQYIVEMRASYRDHPLVWRQLLERPRVVLLCFCTDATRCHRRVLAGILAKLGAVDRGEIG